MSVTVTRGAARDMADRVRLAGRSKATLERIGADYGLLGSEVLEVVTKLQDEYDARRAAPRQPAPAPAHPRPRAQQEPISAKACSGCGRTKPLTEFYGQKASRDGRGSQCRDCNNTRRPTEARLLRTRARHRATAALVEQHRVEFERLYEEAYAEAEAERNRLAGAAAGSPDAAVARLKPGPKRKDETDVVQRLDVARCPRCHTHHDDKHICPACGDETPLEAETVKPYLIRIWAHDQGLGPVPSRGPLPARIVAAFLEERPQTPAGGSAPGRELEPTPVSSDTTPPAGPHNPTQAQEAS